MSVCDLDPSIAGIERRARILRSKATIALTACMALAAVAQANAASLRMNEIAMVAVAIPQSCDKDAQNGSMAFDVRLAVPLIPTVESVSVATPAPETETTGSLPQLRHDDAPMPQPRQIVAAGAAAVGIASTYDPEDPTDLDAGNAETASGERYDRDDWTAAIQIGLRNRFGGVRFGRNYQPTFALVEAGDKRLIVKINDVGPLKPGRIIDLNVRAMRYFDPTMRLGLIADVTVTPLAGQDWALGPVTGPEPVTVARSDRGESEIR